MCLKLTQRQRAVCNRTLAHRVKQMAKKAMRGPIAATTEPLVREHEKKEIRIWRFRDSVSTNTRRWSRMGSTTVMVQWKFDNWHLVALRDDLKWLASDQIALNSADRYDTWRQSDWICARHDWMALCNWSTLAYSSCCSERMLKMSRATLNHHQRFSGIQLGSRLTYCE